MEIAGIHGDKLALFHFCAIRRYAACIRAFGTIAFVTCGFHSFLRATRQRSAFSFPSQKVFVLLLDHHVEFSKLKRRRSSQSSHRAEAERLQHQYYHSSDSTVPVARSGGG